MNYKLGLYENWNGVRLKVLRKNKELGTILYTCYFTNTKDKRHFQVDKKGLRYLLKGMTWLY